MIFYQQLKLLPDYEVSLGFLWQKVFQQIHYGLASVTEEGTACHIGISFPGFVAGERPSLGSCIRLFSQTADALVDLQIDKKMCRLKDYVLISQIQKVPDTARFCAFVRRQPLGTNESDKRVQRYAAFLARKNNASEEDFRRKIWQKRDTLQDLPFVWVESGHGKRLQPNKTCFFPFFIEKREVEKGEGSAFAFNSYGLSRRNQLVAVPEF